jgi:protein gp37
VRSKPPRFNAPLSRKWNQENADGQRVFVCSWSDFFIEEADPWRDEAWEIMRATPWLTYQVLTKRPERIAECQPADGILPTNVWLGATVENQEVMDDRLEPLLDVRCSVHFVSAEPLLSNLDLRRWLPWLQWAIAGGESGPRARPMQTVWARGIANQCKAAGVAYFHKQNGEWRDFCDCSGEMHRQEAGMYRCGREVCGDLLDGQQYHEFPAQ